MAMAGQFGQFIGGFNSQSDRIRQENERDAARSADRANKVFETLANADDPDIRAAAVTGLLTDNHPAKGMDKWFGKMAEHPIYEQIKGLVANGKQPFMDPTARPAAVKSAEVEGAISTAAKHGAPLGKDEIQRASLAPIGAAPPRPLALQSGTIKHGDGTEEPGSYDPSTGKYTNDQGQVVEDAQSFTFHGRSGNLNPSSGGTWQDHIPDKNSPTGFSKVHVGADGKELGRTAGTAPPATGSYTPAPQPGYVLNTKTGTYEPAKGEPGAGARTETPSQGLEALRGQEQRILQMHPPPKGTAFLPVSAEDTAAHRKAMDEEAKKYGHGDFADLQKKIAAATGAVGSAVATPPPRPPTPQPTTKRGKAEKGGAVSGAGLDIDAIMQQLQKDHGK